MKYRAFISYSHADARHARALHRFIESYVVPRRLVGRETSVGPVPRRLRPLFKDREELPSGDSLGGLVNQALRDSGHLIVVCSPRSAQSRWVNEEVLQFKRLGRAERILCIIIDGTPFASELPGRAAEECFCPALRYQLAADGQPGAEPAEPLAADARRSADGPYLARLKLIAGLLGTGLDDLRQRDMQRRYRRMAAVTTAAVAGMALTGYLAWAASVARQDAERRREQADDLIGFMLGDLRERLNSVGRLDILDSVTGKALDYFADLPARDINPHTLANRAEAMLQLGQVQLTRGRLQEAIQPFSEALAALQELVRQDPDNTAHLFDLGQAHFWLGYAWWESENLDAADASMQSYYRISEQLYAMQPDKDDYVLELGFAYNNLAILSNRRGHVQQALEYNQRMISLSRGVYERDPANASYARALADAYSWSGSLLRNDYQFQASRQRFGEYLQLASELSSGEPENTQWLDHVMLGHRFVAELALDLGEVADARRHFTEGLAVAAQLVEIEPANENWQVEKALLQLALARQSIRDGSGSQAVAELNNLLGKVQQWREHSPERSEWPETEAKVQLALAEGLLLELKPDEAALQAVSAASLAWQLMNQDAGAASWQALLADGLILKLRAADQLGGQPPSEATPSTPPDPHTLAHWTQLIGWMHDNLPASMPPAQRSAWVRAQLYAGQDADLDESLGLLRQRGYRHPDLLAALAFAGLK